MPTDYKRVPNEHKELHKDIRQRGSVGGHSFESERTTIEVPESVVQAEKKVERDQFRESHSVSFRHWNSAHPGDGLQKYKAANPLQI